MSDPRLLSIVNWVYLNIFFPIYIVMGLLASTANFCILFVVLRDKEFKKTYSNWLIIFLAFADELFAVVAVESAIHLLYFFDGSQGYLRLACLLFATPQEFAIFFGEIIILSMAFDRFLAITYPIYFRSLKLRNRAIWTCTLAFIFAAFSVSIQIWNINIFDTIPVCSAQAAANPLFFYFWNYSTLFIAIVVFILYALIMRNINLAMGEGMGDRRKMLQTQRVVFKRTSMIIFVFFVFYVIPQLLSFFLPLIVKDQVIGTLTLMVVGSGILINSFLNASINILRTPEVRKLLAKYMPKSVANAFTKVSSGPVPQPNITHVSAITNTNFGSQTLNI